MPPLSSGRVRGALLGTAFGDALGMPVEHLSHQNVRTYYKGIKGLRADEKRGGLEAGQWTGDTQRTLALARVLAATDAPAEVAPRLRAAYHALRPEARRWEPPVLAAVGAPAGDAPGYEGGGEPDASASDAPTNGAAVAMAPVGVWWARTAPDRATANALVQAVVGATHRHPAAYAAAHGQAFAVRSALLAEADAFDRDAFWEAVLAETLAAEQRFGGADTSVSDRLGRLRPMLDDFPLDLQDACDGTGAHASESWPFALAMFARNPALAEASLLAAVNVGGDANSVGALLGALLGAFNGAAAFPRAWHDGVEAHDEIAAAADALGSRTR